MSGVERGGRYPDDCVSRRSGWCSKHQRAYPSQWKAIVSIAEKLDVHRETLRVWVRRAEVDDGRALDRRASEDALPRAGEQEAASSERDLESFDPPDLVDAAPSDDAFLADEGGCAALRSVDRPDVDAASSAVGIAEVVHGNG